MAPIKKLLKNLSISQGFALLSILTIAIVAICMLDTFNHLRDEAIEQKKQNIRNTVTTAKTIVDGLRNKVQKGEIDEAQAKKLAKEMLANARFDGGNYFFMFDFDGVRLVHLQKELEGINALDQPDADGKFYVRNMIDAAKSPLGNGFISYRWVKPGEDTPSAKISFVQGVPQWGWAIGAGCYESDANPYLRAMVIEQAKVLLPSLSLLVLAIVLFGRFVARLLQNLTACTSQLASGDLSTEISAQGRRDEIGALARAVQIFKDNALALAQSTRDKVRMEKEAEEQRRHNEEMQAIAAEVQAKVVQSIGSGLEHLSNGDLTYRITETYEPSYCKLKDDFNSAAEKLQHTLSTIRASTATMRSGTGEIHLAANDLSRRTEQQAASLEETAAALDEITATVRKTAQGAANAQEVVAAARADAEHGNAIMHQTINAMSGIETSTQHIGRIIGAIEEIAFQTNLLALNAGVEAARAGEAGRGFAVIASEVRALAQRAAEAAKEINGLIAASTTHVGRGVDLVGETSKALSRIVAQVAAISTIVSENMACVQEQSTGLDEINKAINQMDQVTQQNAAMVEQTTAAAHSLAEEGEELAQLVGFFDTGDKAQSANTRKLSVQKAHGMVKRGQQRKNEGKILQYA